MHEITLKTNFSFVSKICFESITQTEYTQLDRRVLDYLGYTKPYAGKIHVANHPFVHRL